MKAIRSIELPPAVRVWFWNSATGHFFRSRRKNYPCKGC